MDAYRALNAHVPQILLSIMHQVNSTEADEDYTHTALALHEDIRRQGQEMVGELGKWLQQQYEQQVEETIYKLQRFSLLSQDADSKQVHELLVRDYRRLSSRVGSEAFFGIQGTGEETYTEFANSKALAQGLASHDYLTSLGFNLDRGAIYESWVLFRGSLHLDILEHVIQNRMSTYQGNYGIHSHATQHTIFTLYNLVYQIGEELMVDSVDNNAIQHFTLVFGKGSVQYSPFRQEVAALLEQVAEQTRLLHASFWQRKLGSSIGEEFALRLRLPVGEMQHVIKLITATGQIGGEIVLSGQMLTGRHVL